MRLGRHEAPINCRREAMAKRARIAALALTGMARLLHRGRSSGATCTWSASRDRRTDAGGRRAAASRVSGRVMREPSDRVWFGRRGRRYDSRWLLDVVAVVLRWK
jgi:hypothetical protein